MASFWLEYEENGSPQRFPFDAQTISIGRDKSSDFVLDHPTVSRQHALIVSEGGGVFRLIVLSRGGLTALEGQPVDSEIALYDDALLHIGRLSFRFRSDHAPRRPAAVPPSPVAHQAGLQPGGFGGGPPAGFGGGQPGGGGGGQPGGFVGGLPAGFASGGPVGGGQTGDGFGQSPPMQAPLGEKAAPSKPTGEAIAGGIVSWDDIAQSDEASGDDQQVMVSDYDRIKKASAKGAKKDETNPVLVVVALVAIVGLLVYIFIPTGGDGGGGGGERVDLASLPPVEIDVSCIGEADCMRKASTAYRLGVDLIERRDVENRNLFDGYKQLLQAKAYLEQGGMLQIPEEMGRLEPLHDQARSDLDILFRSLRVRYNQLETNRMHREMADVLISMQAFFPDRTAREHRWAVEHERAMRTRGVYPKGLN